MKGILKFLDKIFSPKAPDYETWTLGQRIDRILNDSDFKRHCECLSCRNPDLDNDMEVYEQIARINVLDIKHPQHRDLIRLSEQELKKSMLRFFLWLDEKTPAYDSLINKALEKQKYFTCTPKKKGEGSNTSHGRDKRIFVNPNETPLNVGALRTAHHEGCHGIEQGFDIGGSKDEKMIEFCSCIVDNLSFEFLKEKRPKLKNEIKYDQNEYMLENINKAKRALCEACVVKVMNGEGTLQEYQEKYKDIIPKELMMDVVRDIEHFNFQGMYQGRYLFGQIAANGFMRLYKERPQLAVKNLKLVMGKQAEMTYDQAILTMGLPNKEKLLKDFVEGFQDRYDTLWNRPRRIENITK